MKKPDRDEIKRGTNQGHAETHHKDADNQERHISGSVNVRGEIEAKRPPDLTKEHTTERKEDKSDSKKKFVVEVLTLIAVVIYSMLTAWQGCLTRSLVKVSQKTFDASERPYVGIFDATGKFTGYVDGKAKGDLRYFPEATALGYSIRARNFGPVQGTNYTATQRLFLNGKEDISAQPHYPPPTTIFPGEDLALTGAIRNPAQIAGIVDGTILLRIEVTLNYDGPSGHYIYCEAEEYDHHGAAFGDAGPQPNCH